MGGTVNHKLRIKIYKNSGLTNLKSLATVKADTYFLVKLVGEHGPCAIEIMQISMLHLKQFNFFTF